MIRPKFDVVIHAPHRLRICAALDSVAEVEFQALRKVTDVSESVLSKQIRVLEDEGYVTTKKGTRDSRVRTWASFTKMGRQAYRAHVAALQEIVTGSSEGG